MGPRIVDERLDFGRSLPFQPMEANHDIRHLDARVVDIVLHFDRTPRRPEHPYESVSQDRVAQMADMRGLIGIDVGVLDDDLVTFSSRGKVQSAQQSMSVVTAVEPNVQVAIAGNLN